MRKFSGAGLLLAQKLNLDDMVRDKVDDVAGLIRRSSDGLLQNTQNALDIHDRRKHAMAYRAMAEELRKLSSWTPAAPASWQVFRGAIKNTALPAERQLLRNKALPTLRRSTFTTAHGMNNIQQHFDALPHDIREGIMNHPLVKDHGMQPTAAFQLMDMTSRGTGQNYTQAAQNLGIIRPPSSIADMPTRIPRMAA